MHKKVSGMKHMMVRYTVRKEKVEAVRKAIGEFVDAVKMHEPYTAYDAYQEGEATFVHMIAFRDEKSEKLHSDADYTNRFVDLLYPNCVSEPEFKELKMLRSSRAEHQRKW
jgi:quinol monooxygenase YgiN